MRFISTAPPTFVLHNSDCQKFSRKYELMVFKWRGFKLVLVLLVLTCLVVSYFSWFRAGKRGYHKQEVELDEREGQDGVSKAGLKDAVVEKSPLVHVSRNEVKQDSPTHLNVLKESNTHPNRTIGPPKLTNHNQTPPLNSKDPPLDVAPPPSQPHTHLLAESYWEQQTSGCRDLQSLQCWAGKYGFSVVEPFVEGSFLRSPLVSTVDSKALKFRDLFNFESWNRESVEKGSSKLVSWDAFLKHAPRKLITVKFKFNPDPNNINARYPLKPRYLQGCSDMESWPDKQQMQFLKEHKFDIVRRVCFNFEYDDWLTLDEFHTEIFGEYRHEAVTVLFDVWRDFEQERILVKESGCFNNGIQEHMQPSEQAITDAQRYIHKYLSRTGSNNSISDKSSYVAIVARLEKVKIHFKWKPGIIPQCLNDILKYHGNVFLDHSLSRTFLAADVGKYGSDGFRNSQDMAEIDNEFSNFFQKLYKDELSIPAWERTFADAGRSDDPGYVALLQKVVASKADCLIFAGGGSFQRHILNLYRSNHQRKDWCIHVVHECTPPYELSL